jgi:hypothetical protein
VEKRKDTEETRLARLRAAQVEAKPLFEQLAEQKQKKQEEYDAVTKLIFGKRSIRCRRLPALYVSL